MRSEITMSRPKYPSHAFRRNTAALACFRALNSQRGLGLIEVLIATALMGILMSGMMSMLNYQSRQTKSLSEKLAISDFGSTFTAAMMDGAVCSYVLNPPGSLPLTFDSTQVSPTTPQKIPVQKLYASVSSTGAVGPVIAQVGKALSNYSSSVVVSSIELLIDTPPNPLPPPQEGVTFKGTWQVEFDPTTLVRPLKPANSSVILTVDTRKPAEAKVTSCISAASGTGPTTMYLYGVEKPGPVPIFGPGCRPVAECPPGWTDVAVGSTGLAATDCKTLLGGSVPQVIRTCISDNSHPVIYMHGSQGGIELFGGRSGNCIDVAACPAGWTDAGWGQSGPPSEVCAPRPPYLKVLSVTRTCYK